MSIASILLENLKKCIFIEEFDDIYENQRTARTFRLFCYSGGFFFHHNVRQGFRKFWIYYNALSFILMSSSCLYYLCNTPVQDYISWLLPVHIMFAVPAKIGLYYWIYSTRDLFSKLIDTMEDNERIYERYLSFCTLNLKKFEAKIKILCCILLFCFISYNFENFLTYEDYIIKFYPTYFPYRTDFLLPFVIRFVQTITVLPDLVLFIAFPTLIFKITIDVYNQFELLSVFLRETSYSVQLTMDEIMNLEKAMDEQTIPNTPMKIRELNIRKALKLEELVRKTTIVAERHRELYSIAKLLAEKVKYILYFVSMSGFLTAVIQAFLASSIIDPTHLIQSLTYISVTCAIFLNWLIYSFVGDLFQNMNNIIATEIYECPWYHLKPKDRRLIHTFLTIVQRPISIVAWRIYPVNLASFPDMLNLVYSNMQRLHTLQAHKRKYSN